MNASARRARNSLAAIFAAPTAIALASIVGLVAGLLGDGWHDLLSWVGLGVPATVILWSLALRRR